MNEVLRLSGIEKVYNRGKPSEVAVLRGIDLTIGRGEVVALVAPSGAGKSTLLHIAGLLDTPDAGEVTIAGQKMTGLSDRRRTEARARGLLASVGVAARADHRPAQLSGGEQQRVAFCRALANAPRLLLADEPTGNLDPATSDQVFGALMELVRATGLSALIATHNMELAARMDRIVRLEAGRVA